MVACGALNRKQYDYGQLVSGTDPANGIVLALPSIVIHKMQQSQQGKHAGPVPNNALVDKILSRGS